MEGRGLVASPLLFCRHVMEWILWLKKSLILQCLQHSFRHGFIILSCVSAIGEHLCQVLLLVYLHKLLVLFQLLLKEIDDVQLVGRIIVINLFVNIRQMWQTVGLFWMLVRHTYSNRCDRKGEFGQFQHINDALWIVERRTQITSTISCFLCQGAECLYL